MKFKDLWIKTPPEEQVGGTDHEEPASGAPLRPESRPPTSVPTRPATGDPGPFLKQLEDALEKANLPSHQDYLDFSKALKNMDALPMDEATKFKAAYATLQSFGCDVKQLLESFDFYNGILDGEKDKFNEALRSTVHEAVGEKEEMVTGLTVEITKDSEEIGKLTARINANQETITRLQNELAEIKRKLTQREADFNAAYAAMTQRLQADAQKIRMYLKP
jgi:FtsZ-binding cell division protein ZapB